MGGSCRVALLGGFRVEVDGRPIPDDAWRHRRSADLVKVLALAPGHRLQREQVMDALWPDLAPEAAAANLRKAVHFARRALGSEDAVGQRGSMLVLWPDGDVTTDVEEFEATRSLELYRGDLLPEDPYTSWSEGPRERLRLLYVDALRSARRWDRLLEVDRTDEEAHRELMRAQFGSGNRTAAMRQFERLRDALHEDLGVAPDPTTVALYEEILAAEGVEPPTPAERARALLAEGLGHWNRMELDDARHAAEAARALAVGEGLGRELGEASGLLGMISHAQGRWREVFRTEFLQTLDRTPELASFVFDAHLCLAEFSLYGPEGPADAAAFAGELLEIGERKDSLHAMGVATLMLGEAELLSGAIEDAERHLTRSAELHERAGARSGRALSLQRLAESALAMGPRRTAAAKLLKTAMSLARSSSLASHLVVRVLGAMILQPRDAARAAQVAAAAEAELRDQDVCQPCSMGYLVAAAVAAARVGDAVAGRRHVEEAERVAGMWQGGPWQASVWEARGELRLAEGDPEQARALFREAAARFAVTGRVLDEARCRAAADAIGATASSSSPA